MNQTANQEPNQEPNQDKVKVAVAGFFEGGNQESSAVRLTGFLALIAAIIFGLLTVLNAGNHGTQGDSSNGLYLTFAFLLAAFAPKTVQKFAEQENKLS